MSTPILATKLYLPPLRPTTVLRTRLVERLNAGLHRKVTLISASAGSGKTTLVSEWLNAAQGRPERKVAWLSLDAGDSDPTRFLSYLVAALRKVAPTIGEGVLVALQSPQAPPIEAILAELLNEIATIPDNFVLVLDDYHLVDAQAVGDALAFVIEHLPPQMHLVIATREDPRLPLARLRARDQLTEVRAAELRFTPAEAAGFLQTMHLDLSAEEVAALETRTEGWIAGLQLAALSMQGQQDVGTFIRSFAGDHRYIVDYLVEEVLQRQPEAVRNFLLQTAILDELNGALCDAVTGQEESKARLEALERGNFFVIPLDDKRHWYRYHHLFADVLHVHLLAEQPQQVAMLHQRASAWYEEQGSTAQAIRHALAAEDFERVARLVERALPALRKGREGVAVLGWLQALPVTVLQRRPVLCVTYAWGLMATGELDVIEPWLQAAERGLKPEAAILYEDEEEFRHVPSLIGIYRAGRAQLLGNVSDTMKYARQVLESAREEDHLTRGSATALLGLAMWTSGDLENAHRTYVEGMARVQLAGNVSDVVMSTIARGDIRIAQGHLREALRTYEQALQSAIKPGEPLILGTADLYVGVSEVHVERNDLDAATQALLKSKELSKNTRLLLDTHRWCVAMARLKRAQGDLEGALEMLDEAARNYRRDFFPNVRPAAALKARVWIAQGRLAEALGWVREEGLSPQDELSYLREFDHITLARVLVAQSMSAQPKSQGAKRSLLDAMDLLQRLREAAYAGGRMGSAIEILIVQALAHQANGDTAAAIVPLQEALTLAEPEGYLRIFVDEGAPMAHLLGVAAERGMMATYAGTLLAAFDDEAAPPVGERSRPVSPMPQPRSDPRTNALANTRSNTLIEPLSERELEVLRLFATELSGPEIALELVIALSTLRTHTKGIYGKLSVNSRREAVRRAEELGLI